MIDWVAAFVGFWGTWQIRKKNKNGFLWLTVMSILWLIIGLQVISYGLVFSSFVFIFLNLYGYYEWRKEENGKIVSFKNWRQRFYDFYFGVKK